MVPVVTSSSRKIDSYLIIDNVSREDREDMYVVWDARKRDYSDKPKTINELFKNEFKSYEAHGGDKKFARSKDGEESWKKSNVAHYQDALVDRYVREGFHLIALGWHSKKPIDEWREPKNRLCKHAARLYTLLGGNIGVACGSASKGLIGIDIDRKNIPKPFDGFISETLTTSSPRGYHIYFRTNRVKPPKGFLEKLKNEYDTECRFEGQYFALPLSHIYYNKKEEDENVRDKTLMYDFIDWKKPILDLEELLEVM